MVLAGSGLASAALSSSDMPFLNAFIPCAKSPISEEIFPRPPNISITTTMTIIQCQILKEPIGEPSAAGALCAPRPWFDCETRLRERQKQGLRAFVMRPQCPPGDDIYLKFLRLMRGAIPQPVMPGLDPGIHDGPLLGKRYERQSTGRFIMDAPVKP